MEVKSIVKAGRRLALAAKLLEDAEKSKSYEDFVDSWYLFLVVSNNVWNILKIGAEKSQQSKSWFGTKIKERKSNPAANYIYRARNDDEHGIEPITSRWTKVVIPGDSAKLEFNEERGYLMQRFDVPQELPREEFAALKPVTDQNNKSHNPPELGAIANENHAIHTAKLAFAYQEQLLVEAGERAS